MSENYEEEFFVSDDEEEEHLTESYIQINDELAVVFNDWVYDAVIHKTIMEINKSAFPEYVELLEEAKRENNGFFSMTELSYSDYQVYSRFFKMAYNETYYNIDLFNKKSRRQILKELKILLDNLPNDDRFYM